MNPVWKTSRRLSRSNSTGSRRKVFDRHFPFLNPGKMRWTSDSVCVIHVDVDRSTNIYRSVKTDDWHTAIDLGFTENRTVCWTEKQKWVALRGQVVLACQWSAHSWKLYSVGCKMHVARLGLRHWNLTSLVDTSEGYENKVRMNLSLILFCGFSWWTKNGARSVCSRFNFDSK